MSGIAEVLLNLGYQVSGSDLNRSALTDRLKRRGAVIRIGHHESHLGDPQVVVVSSAVGKANPEVAAAHRRGIPVIARGEMLAELMRLKYGIAVAGSHGKTSTTSLVASVLSVGGLDPTVVIGGRLKSLRSSVRLGKGEFLVAEADESDGSFLHLNPTIAVITNIDREHLDHYRDYAALKRTFREFAEKVPFYGLSIFCADHPAVAEIAKRFGKRSVTYGLGPADVTAYGIRRVGRGSEFAVRSRGRDAGRFRLQMPGRHNVLNSLAAIAVAEELGIKPSAVRKALAFFKGIGRRFEILRERPVTIVDDYGHHPEEILATLRAARELWKKRRLWALFQPHRYSRTRLLRDDFARVFGDADRLLVTEIYPAGEEPIRGVSGEWLSRKIPRARFVPDLETMLEIVRREIRPGDVAITLGAGDIWKVGRALAKGGEIGGESLER